MSRPKRDTEARRVIADLSYPDDNSIDAYILRNAVWGQTRDHTLPTVAQFMDKVREYGHNAYMATVDIARAYKNFRSDPLDWPLLCARWSDSYYCDITLPFGSRASSYHMQSVARAITEVLELEGIYSKVYMDDLIILAKDKNIATKHYEHVIELLTMLGLPVAMDKLQPPS